MVAFVNTATRKTFASYLFFWSGQIISLLGSTIVQFVIIWWIVIEYLNPMYLAIAYLLGIGVQVIFMPIAGVFVDRWNRKLLLGVSDALQALGAIALIALFFLIEQFEPLTFYWLVVGVITFRGIMGSFHVPAAKAIVPLMVPKGQLNRLNSLQFIFLGVINILGPAIGALLYELYPLRIIIWFDAITFIFALLPLLIISIPALENGNFQTHEDYSNSFFKEFREGINIMRTSTGLVPLLLIITLINLFEIPIIVLGPFFVYTIHSGTVQDLAFVFVSSQFGLLITGIILLIKNGWKRKALTIVIAFYIQISGYFLQAITPLGMFWFMALGAFLFGSMLPIVNSLYKTIIQVVVPPELQGRVISVTDAVSGAVLPIGMLASGPLAEIFGIGLFFILSAVCSFVILSIAWLFTDLKALDFIKEIDVQQESVKTQSIIGIGN